MESLKLLELPGAKDLSEWVEHGGTREQLLELILEAPQWKRQGVPSSDRGNPVNPWSLAAGMDAFLRDEEEPAKFLYPPVIAKEAITGNILTPRAWQKSVGTFRCRLPGHGRLQSAADRPRQSAPRG